MMSWGIDFLGSKMDRDADFYEQTIRPRYVERMRAILGLYPELSPEDLQEIKHDIEWTDIKELRRKLNRLVKNKVTKNKKGR